MNHLSFGYAWAVVKGSTVLPGTWGKPYDGLAIYRSKACAEAQARADQHTASPSVVVRVEIHGAQDRTCQRPVPLFDDDGAEIGQGPETCGLGLPCPYHDARPTT